MESVAAQMRMAAGMARNMAFPLAFSSAPTSAGVPVQRSVPLSMTATREAKEKASSRRCSVRMIVVPSSRLILPRVARKSDAAMGSSWLVGSSRMRTFGWSTMTDARFRSCFCPPDSSVTGL